MSLLISHTAWSPDNCSMLWNPFSFCLFVLMFNVPVNSFSVMSGRSHRFLGFNKYTTQLMCLAQGHNTVTLVGIEAWTSRFGVQRSTTMPLGSCFFSFCIQSLKPPSIVCQPVGSSLKRLRQVSRVSCMTRIL